MRGLSLISSKERSLLDPGRAWSGTRGEIGNVSRQRRLYRDANTEVDMLSICSKTWDSVVRGPRVQKREEVPSLAAVQPRYPAGSPSPRALASILR